MTAPDAVSRPDPAQPGPDVCLVSMPYAGLSTPSLALGLLKSVLTADGIPATVAPAHLWFAERVGLSTYETCASVLPIVHLCGEWTFAEAAFRDDPRRAVRDAEFLRQIEVVLTGRPSNRPGPDAAQLLEDLHALRAAATDFVDATARRVLATGARIVGCTSTFEQHVASLALLRRIHELDPDVITMLGGANCETVMGEATHRCFPWVDFVVSGEADATFAPLCRLALTRGRDVGRAELAPGILGPCHREAVRGELPLIGRHTPARALFAAMDALPTPDFDDYFAALQSSSLRANVRPALPVESSRGCWWGAVHHCTFCGLNGSGMTYRSKSADRVLAELDQLEDRYGISDFEMVDNILDMGYFSRLLPQLTDDPRSRRIFYEIKANVGRDQVRALVRAGVNWVQPGIESLHSDVLRLMDKGVQGWQNVQLLRWAREEGLRISWAVLWGFPGEKDDWYADMAQWFPALEHLNPPSGMARMRFDRYSVYHEQARERGLQLFPIGAMSLVYPVWPADLERLAYFFSEQPGSGPQDYIETITDELLGREGASAVSAAIREWQDRYQSAAYRQRPPTLWYADNAGMLVVTDTRTCATRDRHVLTGLTRALYLAYEAAPRPGRLGELMRSTHDPAVTDAEVEAAVDRLLGERLVVAMDGRVVAVALNGPPPPLPSLAQFPGGHVSATGAGVPAESR